MEDQKFLKVLPNTAKVIFRELNYEQRHISTNIYLMKVDGCKKSFTCTTGLVCLSGVSALPYLYSEVSRDIRTRDFRVLAYIIFRRYICPYLSLSL